MAYGNGILVFAADDGVHGLEPWILRDGDESPSMLADIAAGTASSTPSCFTFAGGRVFFQADDAIHGSQLWTSDGTSEGTRMVAEIRRGGALFGSASSFVAFGNRLVFPADDGKCGMELWISDGTAEGTTMLVDADGSPSSSRPSILYVGGATLWFRAETGRGSEPWWTDGTSAPASSAKNGGCALGASPLIPLLLLPLAAFFGRRR